MVLFVVTLKFKWNLKNIKPIVPNTLYTVFILNGIISLIDVKDIY